VAGQVGLTCIIINAALMGADGGLDNWRRQACLLQMAEITTLREAVAGLVRDGDMVAMEGFTHLIPFAAGHEVIRQRRKNLALVRMTPDVIYDQLIGASCARKLIFSWGGNPGVGSLHRLRDAVEHDWPLPLEIQEHGHGDLANAYVAGASKLPFAVLRAYAGSDLPKHNDKIKFIDCPFTGETLAAVPSIQPDVTVIHAQKADRKGNVLLWGILGVQKEAVLAAKRAIVTVEEIVDDLAAWPNACVLPSWTISAVCCVPGGAFPSYAHGYYERDNRFYQEWDAIARDRETFQSWIRAHIIETNDFAEFRKVLSESVPRVRQ
jgi:glutaconate CoA-transferase, subunit A